MFWPKTHGIASGQNFLVGARGESSDRLKSFEEGVWSKYLAAPGLVLTTIISVVLITLINSNHVIYGGAYVVVTENRAVAGIVVNILAHLLGAIHVYTLCTMVNFATRIKLGRNPMSLDRLKFWSAMCMNRLAWDLPKSMLLPLCGYFVLMILPQTLWTGALTPITTFSTQSQQPLPVPQYSAKSETYWRQGWDSTDFNASAPLRNVKGTFSYAPARDMQALLVNDGASASTRDGSPPIHRKNDNSGYSYQGRSYGLGSSIGLVDDQLNDLSTLGFSYVENGYETHVRCFTNSSSNYGLTLEYDSHVDALPNLYLAQGYAPNSPDQRMWYAQMGFRGPDNIVAMDSWPGHHGTNCTDSSDPVVLVMTAGHKYAQLTNTQCSIALTPARFAVHVNTTSKVINVGQKLDSASDINPAGRIACSASRAVVQLCLINTSLYTSTLGDMFVSNIENVRSQKHASANETENTMRGISETLAFIIDDALLAYGSAQLLIAKDSTLTTATVDFRALRVGERKYIYAIAILNLCIVLVFFTATIFTNGWRGLLRFNYLDVKTVVVGTSMGGVDIGTAAREAHLELGSSWTGDGADRVVGQIPVIIGYKDGLALRPPAVTQSEIPMDVLEGGQTSLRKREHLESESVEELLDHSPRRGRTV